MLIRKSFSNFSFYVHVLCSHEETEDLKLSKERSLIKHKFDGRKASCGEPPKQTPYGPSCERNRAAALEA